MPAALRTLWLPENDPVLGANQPTIDGFTSVRGTGVASNEQEDRGYATGARIEYSAGTYPDVVFTAVKSRGANEVNFAWVVNADDLFQLEDALIVCVRPTHPIPPNASHEEARRIDIFPVSPQGASGNPAGVIGGPHDIRTDQPPSSLQWYRGLAGGTWDFVAAPPAGVTFRCRSWRLNNPSVVPPYNFARERGWAIELRLPFELEGISLSGKFALYWSIMRRHDAPLMSVHFTWPRASDVASPSGAFDDELQIPADDYGEVNMPAITGDAPPPGVRVRRDPATDLPEMGVGTAPYGNVIDARKNADGSANNNNRFACRVENTSVDQADDVIATFSLANWGSPGPSNWKAITPTSGANPAATLADAVEVPAMGMAETTPFFWAIDSMTTGLPPKANPHQCMLAALDSIGGDVYFTEAGARRNMDFLGLSEVVRDAEIGTRGYGKQPRNADLEFQIVAYAREVPLTRRMFYELRERIELSGDPEENVCWAIFFKTFRNTRRKISFRKEKPVPIYEAVGDWCDIAVHHGVDDVPRLELEGKGVEPLGEGRWTVLTRPNRDIPLTYRIWTEPSEGRGRDRPDPDDPFTDVPGRPIRDPIFRDPGNLQPGEPFTRPPWDPRPVPRLPR